MTAKRNIMRLADNVQYLAASALVALAVSCSGDDMAGDGDTKKPENTGKTKTVTLTATVGADTGGSSRVGMSKGEDNATATFYWHNGDSILVQTVSDGNVKAAKLVTEDADGTKEATFSGDIDEAAELGKYAVYPYSDKHTFTSEKALTFTLPNTYNNYKPESSIFSKTVDGTTVYPANSTNVPLLGTITGNKITFRHLGGLAVIRVDKMPAESGTLTITAGKKLSGFFNVADISVEDAEMITAESLEASSKKVTFNYVNATKDAVGVFYLPLATGDYTNVTVTVSAEGGETKSASCGTVSISRAGVTSLALYTTSKGNLIRYYGNGRYLVNGHVFVDLGTSVLWAETNVGASSASDYGDYYAWGETSGDKYEYFYDTYKWTTDNGSTFTRYNSTDGLTTLKDEDDAACVNWGSPCRMPTKSEFDELLRCSWTQSTYGGSEVEGYTVSGKNGYSDKSIFIPFAGYYHHVNFCDAGKFFLLWSSTPRTDAYSNAYVVMGFGSYHYSDNKSRWDGMSVRPVVGK